MKTDIPVLQEISAANDMLAADLRRLFREKGVLVLNLIASPGAGKTSLLEKTISLARNRLRIAVIEGDPSTSLDGQRVQEAGGAAIQINTGGGCHLEAAMVQQVLPHMDLDTCDMVIIENVGNLLCPAGWDLGQDLQIVVASLPEGDDKPLKYPIAFATAQAAVINKIDLEPHIPSRAAKMRQNMLSINATLAVFELSCLTNHGVADWVDWLEAQLQAKRKRPPVMNADSV